MTNKLRIYAVTLGGGLAVVSLWGALTYGGPAGSFLLTAAVGVLVAGTPYATAYGKLLFERRRHAGLDESIFGSPHIDVDRETFLETSAAALESVGTFVDVKRREFPEGPGLVVDHTRFHGTFVRFSRRGEAVVTGIKSSPAADVVDELQRVWSCGFSRRDSNPFLRPIPVRGLPRGLLTLALTVIVIVDAVFLVGLAYPGATYNPGEKATLVGYDLWADIDPGVDDTEAKLSKAGFLITVLREEATEIRWQAGINNSSRSTVNDAAAISADIYWLINSSDKPGLDASERERLERLREDHERARAEVRAAMREPAPNATGQDVDNPFDADTVEMTSTNTTSTETANAIRGTSVQRVD